MICKFCNKPTIKESDYYYKCFDHKYTVNYFKHITSNGAKEGYVFIDRKSNTVAQFHLTDNKFILFYCKEFEFNDFMIELNCIPDYTPDNFGDKIKTLITFA